MNKAAERQIDKQDNFAFEIGRVQEAESLSEFELQLIAGGQAVTNSI
jgi:hypothetical protein